MNGKDIRRVGSQSFEVSTERVACIAGVGLASEPDSFFSPQPSVTLAAWPPSKHPPLSSASPEENPGRGCRRNFRFRRDARPVRRVYRPAERYFQQPGK